MFETYEDMVTIDDVCQMLNIGKNNAYRLLKEGKLHAFKIGRIWKISRQSVIEYVKPAILKATMTEIWICDEYNRLICRHPRSYRDFPLYITDDSHMPPEHLYYKEVNAHDGAYYRRWASVYGESMVTLIDRILRSSKHEEQAYNSCAGVLHSCKDVPHRLVQKAAEKCVEANACKYSYFKKALGMVRNNHSNSGMNGTGKLPSHTNIRGKEAYK